MSVYDTSRQVSAADVARRAGIKLQRHGGREWACCPFHQEKTPSCLFDAAGRYHCFGCQADGDSIDLYAHLYNVDKLTAAKELAGDHTIPRSAHAVKQWKPPFLTDPDDDGFTWGRLCKILHESQKAIEEAKPDTETFWKAVAVHAEAESRLENLLAGEEYGG